MEGSGEATMSKSAKARARKAARDAAGPPSPETKAEAAKPKSPAKPEAAAPKAKAEAAKPKSPAKPQAAASAPKAATVEPKVATVEPKAEATKPKSPAKPEAATSVPMAATVEPKAEATKPKSPAKPEAAAPKAKAEASKPKAATVEPKAEAAKPKSPAKPEAAAPKAKAEAAKPKAATVEPQAEAAKPKAVATKPQAAAAKPQAAAAKPEAAAVKPNLYRDVVFGGRRVDDPAVYRKVVFGAEGDPLYRDVVFGGRTLGPAHYRKVMFGASAEVPAVATEAPKPAAEVSPADAHKLRGNQLLKEGKVAEAVEAYGLAIDADPDVAALWSNRSAARLKIDDAAGALEDAFHAIRLKPSWAKAYHRKVMALKDLGKPQEAAEACEEGLAASAGVAPEAELKELKRLKTLMACASAALMLQGWWNGKVSEPLGGFDQEFCFMGDGKMKCCVYGEDMHGEYELKDVELAAGGALTGGLDLSLNSTKVPYLFKVGTSDGLLRLCCPMTDSARPRTFDGPGFVGMVQGRCKDDGTAELQGLSTGQRIVRYLDELYEIMVEQRPSSGSASSSRGDEVREMLEESGGQLDARALAGQETLEDKAKKLAGEQKLAALRIKYTGDVEDTAKQLIEGADGASVSAYPNEAEDLRRALRRFKKKPREDEAKEALPAAPAAQKALPAAPAAQKALPAAPAAPEARKSPVPAIVMPKAGAEDGSAQCPGGHALKACLPGEDTPFKCHSCNSCQRKQIFAPELVHRCDSCDYDLCGACAGAAMVDNPMEAFDTWRSQAETSRAKPVEIKARRLGSPKAAAGGLPKPGECPRGHALKACMPGRASEFESHRCDFCRRHSICAPELVHRCESCDYDLCAACAGKAAHPAGFCGGCFAGFFGSV